MLVVDTAKTRPSNVSNPSCQRALPFGNFGLLNCGVRHARIFYCPHLGARTSEIALALLGSRYERARNTPQVLEGRLLCMCRNIKNLFNFDPPVTNEEIRNASLQFVRKISGFNKPSRANEASFVAAIDEVARACSRLLRSLETNAPPKNREEEAEKLKARAAERFGD